MKLTGAQILWEALVREGVGHSRCRVRQNFHATPDATAATSVARTGFSVNSVDAIRLNLCKRESQRQ